MEWGGYKMVLAAVHEQCEEHMSLTHVDDFSAVIKWFVLYINHDHS